MIVGKKFGRLTALRHDHGNRWIYSCECGAEKSIDKYEVNRGNTRSCGCLRKELMSRPKSHGLTGTRIHSIHRGMMKRCYNRNHHAFAKYGGRGIKVCKRWQNVAHFAKDMGSPPGKGYTLDRINNGKGYSPSNCRWATWREQENNRRNSRRITFCGETKTIMEWSRELDVPHSRLYQRLSRPGWTVVRAFTEPSQKNVC
jgi:hypothetical protein